MDKIGEEGRKISDNVWYFDLGNSYLSVTFCKGKGKVCVMFTHTHTQRQNELFYFILQSRKNSSVYYITIDRQINHLRK